MLDITIVAIIIIVVILLLLIITKNPSCNFFSTSENFDTYYNHDMGVHTVQQKTSDISVDESILTSKYNWKDVDNAGQNNIDKYYDTAIEEKNSNYDPNRDETEYDTKFQNLPSDGYNLRDMEANTLTRHLYNDFDTTDDPKSTVIGLSQKLW